VKRLLFLLSISSVGINSLDGMMMRMLKPNRPFPFTRANHTQFDYQLVQPGTQRKMWPVVVGWSLGVGALAFVSGAVGGLVLGYHAGHDAGHECGQHDANIHMFLALSQFGMRGIRYDEDGVHIPSTIEEQRVVKRFFEQARKISGIEHDAGRFIVLSTHPHPSTLFEKSDRK
jgi:hypothetical protein